MPTYKTIATLPDPSKGETASLIVTRVIEAKNVAAARNHVAKDVITVDAIDTPEAMELAAKGIKLERAASES